MNEELKQSALDAIVSRVNAWTVSGGAVLAGLSAYVEPVFSLVGLVLAAVLTYGHIKKLRIERKILYQQSEIIERKEAERIATKKARQDAGLPLGREDDAG